MTMTRRRPGRWTRTRWSSAPLTRTLGHRRLCGRRPFLLRPCAMSTRTPCFFFLLRPTARPPSFPLVFLRRVCFFFSWVSFPSFLSGVSLVPLPRVVPLTFLPRVPLVRSWGSSCASLSRVSVCSCHWACGRILWAWCASGGWPSRVVPWRGSGHRGGPSSPPVPSPYRRPQLGRIRVKKREKRKSRQNKKNRHTKLPLPCYRPDAPKGQPRPVAAPAGGGSGSLPI